MRAILIEKPGSVSLAEVPRPAPGPQDVLIRSEFAGVCRTDMKILAGNLPLNIVRYPCIPGHEWSGRILEAGDGVEDLAPGDRVVAEGMIACHRCRRCRDGQTNLCEHYDQLGFTRPGGYGEVVCVPRHAVHKLAGDVPLEIAALIEPASCVLHGIEKAAPRPGESWGVIGIGSLGSICLILAALYKPLSLVAFGVRAEELEFATRLGATSTVNAKHENPAEAAQGVSQGGLDIVVETAGSPAAIETAFSIVRPGGRVVALGSAGDQARMTLAADVFMRGDLAVLGSLSYTTRTFGAMVQLLGGGALDLSPVVSHRVPLGEFQAAFDAMSDPKGHVAKILLTHDA